MDTPRSSAQPVRAAIVGAGLMGHWHAHALARARGRLIAVADPNASRAQQLARRYRARDFDSLAALLAHDQMDAVHICTPLETHVALARQALAAGAHLIVEKPLAPDTRATEELLDQARACRRLLVPVHQFIFQPGVQQALAQLPRLAPLAHVELTTMTAGGERGDDAARDQLVADILPHALALFQRLMPAGLDRIVWSVQHPMAGELRALGRSGSTSLVINISTHGRPTRNELRVVGAHGSAHADLFHGFVVFEDGRISRADKIARPFSLSARTLFAATTNLTIRALRRDVAYPGLRELIGAFYRAIRDGTPAPIAPAETLAVARARDQLLAQ